MAPALVYPTDGVTVPPNLGGLELHFRPEAHRPFEIIETLSREHGVDLDEGLDERQRAVSVLLQRMLEENLYFLVLHDRWVVDANWPTTKDGYFGAAPWPVRALLVPFIRNKVIAAARGQGVLRLTDAQRERKGREDLDAFAHLLGDREHVHGRPSTIDATAYAFLANLLWAPYESPLSLAARAQPRVVSYCERMRERYWSDWPPVAAASLDDRAA